MSYVAGCRLVVSSKYTAGLNSPYKRSNKLLWSKIEGTSGRFLDFLDAEAFKVISLLFVCVSSRTTESLFALRIYAHCVYERANTVIQEGVVYRQRHTRERERERERERDDRWRESGGPSTSFVRMEREVSGARGWAGCISEKHEIATITPCPRGESYLHWNASRRSVAETHHVERSTGCPDEREKLPWPRAVRKRVGERGSLNSVPFFLFPVFFFLFSLANGEYESTLWAANQRRACFVIFIGREDVIADARLGEDVPR